MKQIITFALVLLASLTFGQPDSDKSSGGTSSQIDTISKTDKIEIVNKSFDTLVAKLTEKDKEATSMWQTLIPLFFGAVLTFLTSFLIDLWKIYKDNKVKKQQLISRGRAKIYLISQVLKDLAMYKVHKQYYLRASQIVQGSDKGDSFKKHYEKGQEQRITESKLDESIADYFETVTEYAIVAKNIDRFQRHFQSVFDFEHPKSSDFADIKSLKNLVIKLRDEEKRLNEEYKNLTDILEQIQTTMK